jgi:hypothetical protein
MKIGWTWNRRLLLVPTSIEREVVASATSVVKSIENIHITTRGIGSIVYAMDHTLNCRRKK